MKSIVHPYSTTDAESIELLSKTGVGQACFWYFDLRESSFLFFFLSEQNLSLINGRIQIRSDSAISEWFCSKTKNENNIAKGANSGSTKKCGSVYITKAASIQSHAVSVVQYLK